MIKLVEYWNYHELWANSRPQTQSQPHLEPIQDETEEIDLTPYTSEGGEDDWSDKYDVAETQQT